mgnify:CR=1 FL=1
MTVTGQGFSTSGLSPKVRFLNEATLVADPLLAVDDTKTAVNADGTQVSVLVTVASTATLGARAISIDLQDGTPLIVTRSSLSCGQGTAGAGQPTPTPTATCFVFSVVGGPTITAVSPRGRRIGAIFQDPLTSLNPLYRVGDQLVETIREHLGLDAAAARRRAVDLLS